MQEAELLYFQKKSKHFFVNSIKVRTFEANKLKHINYGRK